MTQNQSAVNHSADLTASTIAPLQNVALCMRLLEKAINRPQHLPGMVALYGFSGWGKSFSAAYAANKYRAYYIECKSSWTKKAVLLAVLKEMGIAPAANIYQMVDQVAEQLATSGYPLIIDEMDHIVEKKAVEVIRDIYAGSNAAILLIGEENLPTKLQKWERFHNRIMAWQPAQPANIQDAKQLAKLYSPDVLIAPDLMQTVLQQSASGVRRICVNIYQINQEAKALGLMEIDKRTWADRPLYTGQAPARRRA